jgi:hypothetical protein
LILDALAFPEGCKGREGNVLVTATGSIVVELVVEHEDLPVVMEGDVLPLLSPRLTQKGERPSAFFDFDWGLD